MEHRMDRVGLLSPLEESSAEISRDSGIVSHSASSLSGLSETLSSGTVSQSPSGTVSQSPSGTGSQSPSGTVSQSPSFGVQSPSFGVQSPSFNASEPDQDQDQEADGVLRQTAHDYSSYIRVTAGDEILCLEKSLEEMLTRVDAFVGMLDMIRNDTSQIVHENLPQIQRKSEEMRQIYRRIDKLDAFVKMVSANVTAMEEQVTQAEGEQATLPGAFKKMFRNMNVPGFLNKPASPRRPAHQELPAVFRTDDYFPSNPGQ